MPTDPLDLADPIRLLILLLPAQYRAPAAMALSALVATQAIASLIVARLPLSAREHPRWGRVVRALHWYSVLRLRDEAGTVKAPGADVAPRVTLAPDAVRVTGHTTAAQLAGEVALQTADALRSNELDLRATQPPPPPAIAPSPLRAPTLTGVAAADEEARYKAARRYVAGEVGFDATRFQDVTDAAREAQRVLASKAGE